MTKEGDMSGKAGLYGRPNLVPFSFFIFCCWEFVEGVSFDKMGVVLVNE